MSPIVVCACCGKTGEHRAHGWRAVCYNRWRHHGRPPGGPPRPMTKEEIGAASRGKPRKPRLERIEEFVLVLQTRPADSVAEAVAQAAAAVSRCDRTGWRYVTSLRDQGVPLRSILHRSVPR